MENTMELYKKILRDRIRIYYESWEKDMRPQDYHSYQCFQSALNMFEYVETGDYAGLAQFDYMGEEKEGE